MATYGWIDLKGDVSTWHDLVELGLSGKRGESE